MSDYLVLLLIATFALHGCSNNPPVSNDEPWFTATPEEQGFDSEVLLELLERIDTEHLDIHSMVLIRDDKIFFEFYNYPYGPDTLHHTKSAGKSDHTQLVTLGDQAAPALSAAEFGAQRPDGKSTIAAAGWWLNDKEFSIDMHQVGYPIRES